MALGPVAFEGWSGLVYAVFQCGLEHGSSNPGKYEHEELLIENVLSNISMVRLVAADTATRVMSFVGSVSCTMSSQHLFELVEELATRDKAWTRRRKEARVFVAGPHFVRLKALACLLTILASCQT